MKTGSHNQSSPQPWAGHSFILHLRSATIVQTAMFNTRHLPYKKSLTLFTQYLDIDGYSDSEIKHHIENLKLLWVLMETYGLYNNQELLLNYSKVRKIELLLKNNNSQLLKRNQLDLSISLIKEWLEQSRPTFLQSNSKRLLLTIAPPIIASILLVGLISIDIFTTKAYSQTSIPDVSTPTTEYPITPDGVGSYQSFTGAGSFADEVYATLRLENYGTKQSDGSWSGPDFLVAQSNGKGVFYIQSGGNLFTQGNINANNGLIRNNLNVVQDIDLGGGLTAEKDVTATNFVGNLLGNVTSKGNSSFNDIESSGKILTSQLDVTGIANLSQATIDALTISGTFELGNNTLPWSNITKSGSSIRDLADVSISSPSNGQTLSWDSSTKTWKNQTASQTQSTTVRSQEDYVITLEDGSCKAYNTTTAEMEITSTNHSTCIKNTITAAGEGGVISFKAGDYSISEEFEPLYRQTWIFPRDAVFSPTGNNRIINISSVDEFSLLGTLLIIDSAENSTSVEAIKIDDMAHSYFQNIFIRNYYDGVSISGTAGGTHENTFVDLYMQVRNRGVSVTTSSHDNHFIHTWVKGPAPDSWATSAGLYIATGGTQGGNTFDNIEALDMNVGLELPGAFEAWFGKVLVDNPLAEGVSIGGSAERVFFDTLWTASGGDGVVLSGNTSSPVDKVQINKLYSWLNGNYGVKIESYVENLSIGMLTVQRNAKGIGFNGIENKGITINSLTSFENTDFGVDGSGITEDVFVNNALVYDTVLGLDYFSNIIGSRPGTGSFQSRGVATIENGNTTVTVNHGLEGTPTNITLTPFSSEVTGAYISARTATTFTITVGSAVSADREIAWDAQSGRITDSELLANVNVESGTTTPTSWNKSASNTTWSTDEARSGSYSLQINVSASTGDWRSDSVEVSGDQNYRLRAFVKGTGSAGTYVTIRWFSNTDGSGFISEDNITLNSTYSDWTEVKSDLKAPATAQSADVMFRVPSSSTANIYADDFSVRRIY